MSSVQYNVLSFFGKGVILAVTVCAIVAVISIKKSSNTQGRVKIIQDVNRCR